MKKRNFIKALYITLLFPLHVFAQEDITGLWKGTLYNDTTQKYLTYELAISEDNGKLTGYSYTVFDIDGKQEVGVKKLKIKRKKDRILIEDIDLIANNYSAPPPKDVRQLSVVNLVNEDSILVLSGTWSTNRTKKYRPLTGTLRLERKNDFRKTELVKKLEEMKLTEKLSFTQPVEKADATAVAAQSIQKNKAPVITEQPKADVDENKEAPKQQEPVAVAQPKEENKPVAKKEPVIEKEPVVKEEDPVVTRKEEVEPVKKQETVKEQPKAIAPVVKNTAPAIVAPVIPPPAAEVAKRRVANTQEIFYKSDSLVLTLYDNGEVDGDTVSVIMNGELIFAKQGLNTKANSKTIYIDKNTPDSLTLVMYAESLGSIPPNTGLLVIHDGESIYELRFSADLQSNAAIILRRKKKSL